MERKKIFTILIVLAVALLLTNFAFFKFFTGKVVDEEDTIKIGFIGPLTGFGAAWGLEQQNSMNIAINEINNAGGINGKQLRVVYEDGKCDGKEATNIAQKLINIDNVKILMPVCSSETLAVAPIAEENKVLVMAVWPTNPSVSYAGDYVFRNSYSDKDVAKTISESLSKYDKVGTITELADYSVGLRDSFKENYPNEIVEEEVSPNSKDVKTQITKIISKNPEAVLINPNSISVGLEIIEQLKEIGYGGDLYGNFFGGSSEVQTSLASERMIFFGDPIVKDSSIKNHLFKEYETNYGRRPDFDFAVSAQYDAVYIIAEAIEACDGEEDTGCIRDYLYTIESFTGALGTYRFDSNGDVIGLKPSIKQIVKGEGVVIG